MCTNSHNASHRQRAHQELMMLQASYLTTSESKQVPMAMATIYTADILTSADKNGGIFRSSTARAVLTIASIALLLISLIGHGTNDAANVKDLSDTVMNLTQQLHTLEVENEYKIHEVETLEKQVNDKDIELSWESQHVANQKETQELMFRSMLGQIQQDEDAIKKKNMFTHEIADTAILAQRELDKEHEENDKLKLALASALEELATARKELPGGSKGGEEKQIFRKLRGVSPYQPGDNIEIIEYEEGGKVALRPGIVSEVNKDGTFDLVKLEESITVRHKKIDQFQRYHVYEEGSSALIQESRDTFDPITIVKFLPGTYRKGFEIHGSYQYTIDKRVNKVVREARAGRIHRYADIGEGDRHA